MTDKKEKLAKFQAQYAEAMRQHKILTENLFRLEGAIGLLNDMIAEETPAPHLKQVENENAA